MLSLASTLVLSVFSFLSSCFVVLKIITPVLPPHPMSRKVHPSEFGLPSPTLSFVDQGYLWLVACDLISLGLLVWQSVEHTATAAEDPASASRLWIALTLRQTCLLFLGVVVLVHVRSGKAVSLGRAQWMLGAPTAVLAIATTGIIAILSATGISNLLLGLGVYAAVLTVCSAIGMASLIHTLFSIKRNLTSINESNENDNWPLPTRSMNKLPRCSFATEDIDAARNRSSWFTSVDSMNHEPTTAWSFSGHDHSSRPSMERRHPALVSTTSIPAKSAFWFGQNSGLIDGAEVPPVPDLPSPYKHQARQSAPIVLRNSTDPYRQATTSGSCNDPNIRIGSKGSWLTETAECRSLVSAWDFPPNVSLPRGSYQDASLSHLGTDRLPRPPPSPVNPISSSQVLGGYAASFAPGYDSEKNLASFATVASVDADVGISTSRAIFWMVIIILPFILSAPFLFTTQAVSAPLLPVLLSVSVAISSPLLAVSIITQNSLPAPIGIFDVRIETKPTQESKTSRDSESLTHYKRSGSVTVVEGRRSGDVWISKGEAVTGRGKIGRALSMLAPQPRLSVLPIQSSDSGDDGEDLPPFPTRDDPTSSIVSRESHSIQSSEIGPMKSSFSIKSDRSGVQDAKYVSKVMVAQKNYSAMAQVIAVPPSPILPIGEQEQTIVVGASGTQTVPLRTRAHMRSRSVSSINAPQSVGNITTLSAPPRIPLPPIPPTLKNGSLSKIVHQKSCSSGFEVNEKVRGHIDEIDAMLADMLPILEPGIKVSKGIKVTEDNQSTSWAERTAKFLRTPTDSTEFRPISESIAKGSEMANSASERLTRATMVNRQKRNHFSLPSLSLGRGSIYSSAAWQEDISRVLNLDLVNAATEMTANNVTHRVENAVDQLEIVQEDDDEGHSYSPHDLVMDGRASARTSLNTLLADGHFAPDAVPIPTSASPTSTCFDFEADLGPNAESTPQTSRKSKVSVGYNFSCRPTGHNATTGVSPKRSSIVYIKYDENDSSRVARLSHKQSSMQWRVQGTPPLVFKQSTVLQRSNSTESKKAGSPGEGLRQLSLLRERGLNCDDTGADSNVRTRSLALDQKKLKTQSSREALKSLRLTRSDTAKARGELRVKAGLPILVIRPPSSSEQFGHS